MISRRVRILAIMLVCSFYVLSFGVGQQQTAIQIGNYGNIAYYRRYVCGNYNSTHYYAQNNITGDFELISTDATQIISYAVSKLTPGRTWQEKVLLKGNFLIGTTLTLSQSNVLLDCRQATLTSAVSIMLQVRASVTILGGHWIGQTGCGIAIQTGGSGGINCVIDNLEIANFNGGLQGAIEVGSGSNNITIQNCSIHDNDNNYCINILSGRNKVANCHMYNSNTHTGYTPGIFVSSASGYNQIIDCEFDHLYSHAIYTDGGSSIGHNIIARCKFHDVLRSSSGVAAACHVKSQNNQIYDNDIWNWPESYAISVYSEFPGYTANDNDIHDNTFTNVLNAVVLGHKPTGTPYMPASRNLIHDNVFTNCTNAVVLNPEASCLGLIDDTKIYYNDFHNCLNPFLPTGSPKNLIQNTVIAYNYFDTAVPSTNVNALQSYVNTMRYQNTFYPPNTTLAMADYNPSSVMDTSSWYYVAPRM